MWSMASAENNSKVDSIFVESAIRVFRLRSSRKSFRRHRQGQGGITPFVMWRLQTFPTDREMSLLQVCQVVTPFNMLPIVTFRIRLLTSQLGRLRLILVA